MEELNMGRPKPDKGHISYKTSWLEKILYAGVVLFVLFIFIMGLRG
jgi:hypothetical protein